MGNRIIKDVPVPVPEPVKVPSWKPVKVSAKKPSNVTTLNFLCGELSIVHVPEDAVWEEPSDDDLCKKGLVVPNGDKDEYLQFVIDVLAECKYKFRLVPGHDESVVYIYKPKMANSKLMHWMMRSNVSMLIVRATGYYNPV